MPSPPMTAIFIAAIVKSLSFGYAGAERAA
jgi:hypothetical protein